MPDWTAELVEILYCIKIDIQHGQLIKPYNQADLNSVHSGRPFHTL